MVAGAGARGGGGRLYIVDSAYLLPQADIGVQIAELAVVASLFVFPLAAVDIVAPAGAFHAAIARAVSVLPHLHLGTVDAQLGVRT